MKKILSIFLILFCAYFSYGQQFVLPPRSTPVVTVQDSRWRALMTAYMPHTHGLTLNGGLDTLGAFIYEDSSRHVWYRDSILSGGHKWTMVVSPSDISITGLIQQGTNVTITGSGTTLSPYIINSSGGGGGGSIVGAGNLTPLFTTGVAFNNITFAFQNAAAFRFFGNPTNANGPPFYFGTDATMHFAGNLVGVDTAFLFSNLNFYNTITQVDSFTFTLNTPTGRHDTVQIKIPSFGFVSNLNNGLTLTGTLGQLGGPLVQNTLINGGGFSLGIQGNRFATGMGAAIVAANNLTTGSDGNLFQVTGLTQINAITTTNWQPGAEISFIFTSTPILKNNTVGGGGTAPMQLAGSIDYQAAPGDYIKLQYDGSVWHEVTRKLTSAGGAYIFSNGITESPATRVKLGGTLTQNTTLAGAGTFWFAINGGRFQTGAGAAIVAANNLVTGSDGNQFSTTGNTQINAITTTNWQAGAHIELIFTGTPLLKNNTAGGVNTSVMLLAGGVDYQAAAGDLIGLSYDGTVWHETNRKLAGSVTSLTFNNGLTATGTLVQLGGTLIQGTTVTQGANQMTWTGSNASQVMNLTSTGGGNALNIVSNGGGIRVNTSAAGTGVFAQTSGVSIFGYSSGAAGTGVFGQADGGSNASAVSGQALAPGTLAGSFLYADATNSTVIPNTQYNRATSALSSTITAGFGESVDFILEATNAGNFTSNQFISKWSDPNTATRTSLFSITGVSNAITTTLMDINGTTANFYGTGGSSISAIGGQLGATLTGSITGVLASGPQPFWGTNPSTVTNTIVDGLLLQRNGAYNGAAGVGIQIRLESKNSTGSIVTAGILSNKLTTATAGSEVSQWDFSVNNGGSGQVTKFSVSGPATFVTGTRFEMSTGNGVASANNLTLGTDGNVFHITGTTQINAITTANWQAGSEIILIFDAAPTVKNNTAGGGGTAVMHLAGAIDFSATSSDVLTLIFDGTSFYEKCRSVN